jgi:hypothetical protein
MKSGSKNSVYTPKLGLKLEKVCQKLGHDRNKITYICTNKTCENQRLNCSYCFLELHQDHPESR